MTSKFWTWTKGDRRNAAETWRTGGFLPIETDVVDTRKSFSVGGDAKSTSRAEQRPKPLNLHIIPDYNAHKACLAPASALDAALSSVSSASNLLAVVNDMLRSPAMGATVCPRSELHKPLPGRPRSISCPPTPELPELPGSLLLVNQGLPSPSPVAGSATGQDMRSVRSGNLLSPTSAGPRSNTREAHPGIPQHKKSLSDTHAQRRSKSKQNLVASPSSTDSKFTTCSVSTNGGQASSGDSTKARAGSDHNGPLQPLPLISDGKNGKRPQSEALNRRNELAVSSSATPPKKQIDELKSTITAQDNTISTLSAQFASLRTSHEAHIASLVEAHDKEVATLRTYTRVLEEQQAQRTLHHASSNHLLLLLDTTEQPQSPIREQTSQQNTAGNSATSTRSFQSALEHQPRSAQTPREGPDMDHLKRKLSTTKRPDTGSRDAVRELNQLRQTNEALQRQVESLMSKLNQSKKNERSLQAKVEEIEESMKNLREKVEGLEKSEKALSNTVDHLEGRLVIANIEKVDAQEELHNLQHHSDPFDNVQRGAQSSNAAGLASAKTSATTVFSSGVPGFLSGQESKDVSTIQAFITHIERLQEKIKEKDSHIAELEQENERCRLDYDDLEHDHKALNEVNDKLELQADIHTTLLKKAKGADGQLEELKNNVSKKDKMVKEKDRFIQMIERQLEHHQLLLYAEVRRQAKIALQSGKEDDTNSELQSLASKEDVDRWVDRLQQRLRKETPKPSSARPQDEQEAQIFDLKREVEFYVKEIIYYKMDVRGFKHDIKKLQKNFVARISSRDVDSPTPSLCHRCSNDTPVRARFAASTSGLGISATPSPISTEPLSATGSMLPSTPSTSIPPSTPQPHLSPSRIAKTNLGVHKKLPKAPSPTLTPNTPSTPQTPPRKAGRNVANDADNVDPGVSPKSVCLTPERRKPTPPSPQQEQRGDMSTNFPLSTPAAPKRHDTQRSNSDSIITMYAAARTPDWTPPTGDGSENEPTRERSASVPDSAKGKTTPERPPRPRYGLFESPNSANRTLPSPPKMNVLAEAERHSPPSATVTQHARSRSDPQTPTAPRERKGSLGGGSGSNIPFVIAMGSPHNPALMTPPATASSNKQSKPDYFATASPNPPPADNPKPSKQRPTNLPSPSPHRAGLGGTMASSPPASASASASASAPPPHPFSSSSSSFSNPHPSPLFSRSQLPSPSRYATGTPSHGRSSSASGILASGIPLMRGKGKARKESISGPIAQERGQGMSGVLGEPFGAGVGRAI